MGVKQVKGKDARQREQMVLPAQSKMAQTGKTKETAAQSWRASKKEILQLGKIYVDAIMQVQQKAQLRETPERRGDT